MDLRNPKPEQPLEERLPRREFLKYGVGFGGVALAALTGIVAAVSHWPKYKTLSLEQVLQEFDGLPLSIQTEIIDHLDGYTTAHTEIGKVAKEINDRIKLPSEIIDDPISTQSGENNFRTIIGYDYLHNKIGYLRHTNHDAVNLYLIGIPSALSLCHENLHYIQDINSKWDKFQTLVINYGIIKEDGQLHIEIPLEDIPVIIANLKGKHRLTQNEASKELVELIERYTKAHKYLTWAAETQAHLSVSSSSEDRLYDIILHSHNDTSPLTKEEFGKLYQSTLALTGMLNPMQAAEFVGRNGDSIDEYVTAVEKLKNEKGINNALQRGMDRQKQIAKDLATIALEAARFIDAKYSEFTKASHQPTL